ncbi:ABC transporter substrate-binding protein [Nostoc sp. FACHB-152]|uniref:ABC transporter substrate-binding protein n=1 Tax=Nostoc sp. FACHB-152 TaxID=2692837 RepID=UPI0018EFD01A|nr:ABC transporter substrate-binding protein [Nostoc sp. FACHB-152]
MEKISKHFTPLAIATAVMVFSAISVKVIENTSLSASNNNLYTSTATPETTQTSTPESTLTATPESSPSSTLPNPIEKRLSFGEKILVTQEAPGIQSQDFQTAKTKGVEEIAAGNYLQAANEFQTAIGIYPNAPETLIYLNNSQINNQDSYTIAVVVPIDSNRNGALEILRGVAQAQSEVNEAGGINGIPLKVLIANDDNQPEIAQQIASELVKKPEVLGVIGHFSSDATLAAKEQYNTGQLVAISPVSRSAKLSNSSPYVFRTVPSDAIAAKTLAIQMFNKLKKQKAAVFYNSQIEYSRSLKSQFVEEVVANGGQVDQDLEFDLSDSNFSARNSVEKAVAKGTQVLMFATDSTMLDKALLVLQANKKRLSLLGGDDMYASRILTDGADTAVGLVVAVAWQLDANPNSDFARKSQELWQGKVNWRTAMSYDAAEALITALERDPTRSGVKQSLSGTGFFAKGASGVIKFLSSGDRNGSIQLVEIRPRKSPATGYEFVPIR